MRRGFARVVDLPGVVVLFMVELESAFAVRAAPENRRGRGRTRALLEVLVNVVDPAIGARVAGDGCEAGDEQRQG